MKTGVLVHGCNLNIENWRHVAWGDPPRLLGRIPQGILIAEQFNADLIVFGTGASEKEFRLGESKKKGQKLQEAEYSFEYLNVYFDALSKFELLKERIPELSDSDRYSDFRDKTLGKIVLDTESNNTVEEITLAGKLFAVHEIEQVILVSSPSHVVRCLRDAAMIYQGNPTFERFQCNIHGVPSLTCYEGTDPGDVVVIEPPHRPDRHVVPTHRRIQRMLTLQKLKHHDLVQLIEEFDDLLQRYEHKYFNEQS